MFAIKLIHQINIKSATSQFNYQKLPSVKCPPRNPARLAWSMPLGVEFELQLHKFRWNYPITICKMISLKMTTIASNIDVALQKDHQRQLHSHIAMKFNISTFENKNSTGTHILNCKNCNFLPRPRSQPVHRMIQFDFGQCNEKSICNVIFNCYLHPV